MIVDSLLFHINSLISYVHNGIECRFYRPCCLAGHAGSSIQACFWTQWWLFLAWTAFSSSLAASITSHLERLLALINSTASTAAWICQVMTSFLLQSHLRVFLTLTLDTFNTLWIPTPSQFWKCFGVLLTPSPFQQSPIPLLLRHMHICTRSIQIYFRIFFHFICVSLSFHCSHIIPIFFWNFPYFSSHSIHTKSLSL